MTNKIVKLLFELPGKRISSFLLTIVWKHVILRIFCSYLEILRKGPTEKSVLSEEKEIETWSLSHVCTLIKLCLKLPASGILVW